MIGAQVVIVGGGVMGVSLLYHLVKNGWSDVLLVEKSDLTHGSTWHAAGLCTHFAHNPTIQEMRATSVRLYRDILPSETGQSCGFHPTGAMRITRNPDRMDEFAHVAGLSDFTGYPLELITPGRIQELHPLTVPDGLVGGIYEPDDGHVDPTLATTAMAQLALDRGGKIMRYNPVHAIRFDGDHWIVKTVKDTLRANHIVNAAGTWGWEIGQMMGLNIPSVPVLHQYLITDSVPEVAQHFKGCGVELPIIRDPEESWYLRQEHDGLVLGLYEKQAQIWSVDGVPPEFGAELLPPDLDRLEPIITAAIARIPAIANGGVKSVINGPITFTPDANPLIGPAHGLPNAWLLTGSSMGVMEGGGAGRFLAHWMTHGAPPMDALAIDSRRFGTWADRSYRVDKAIECFGLQFGVHYPYEERPAGRNKRRSPLHDLMLDRGAVMGVAHGRERPNWFSDCAGDSAEPSFRRGHWFDAVAHEVKSATEAVALADLSALTKFDITGPDTRAYVDSLGANAAPANGKIGLTHALTSTGGVCSEFSVAMLNDDHAYLMSAAAAEEMDLDLLTNHQQQFDVAVKNRTEEFATIGIMGPRSRHVLATLTSTNLGKYFPWLSIRLIDIAETPVRALRISYLGELGWELHVPVSQARSVFLLLEAAGKDYGIGYYGAFAANSMRLEKGYRAWGSDLTSERTPLESGLGFLVNGRKRKFIGQQALLDRAKSDSWKLLLLEIHGKDIDPFFAHPVVKDGRPVGIVTSGAYGHRCKKMLALAYLRDTSARANLTVSILGKHYSATIFDEPPFDPANSRLRS